MQEKIIYDKKCQVYDTPLRIAFAGKMAAGKTTLAKSLDSIYNLERIAFADKLKEYCSSFCEYNQTKKIKTIQPIVDQISIANDVDSKIVFEMGLSPNDFNSIPNSLISFIK